MNHAVQTSDDEIYMKEGKLNGKFVDEIFNLKFGGMSFGLFSFLIEFLDYL